MKLVIFLFLFTYGEAANLRQTRAELVASVGRLAVKYACVNEQDNLAGTLSIIATRNGERKAKLDQACAQEVGTKRGVYCHRVVLVWSVAGLAG